MKIRIWQKSDFEKEKIWSSYVQNFLEVVQRTASVQQWGRLFGGTCHLGGMKLTLIGRVFMTDEFAILFDLAIFCCCCMKLFTSTSFMESLCCTMGMAFQPEVYLYWSKNVTVIRIKQRNKSSSHGWDPKFLFCQRLGKFGVSSHFWGVWNASSCPSVTRKI